MTTLQSIILGIALVVTLVAILFAVWTATSTKNLIRHLTASVYDLMKSEYHATELPQQLPPGTSEDVSRLAQAFNQLIAQARDQFQTLGEERGRMNAVYQSISDGVLIVDKNGLVQWINPAAERMFSVEKRNVLGISLVEALRHHQFVELWQNSRSTGKTESALLEISTDRLFLQGTARPLDDVSPGDTLLVFNNLTRQRYLETVRRDFISNLSHELRTPLASLKALTETLQSGALEDPAAARRFLQRMETEVDALTQMVAELLELSRIESGRVPLQLKPIRPADLIASAVERLRLQAERARLDLRIQCREDLPLILGDLPRLEQVLVNLLHNAIKFTPPGGKIQVTAGMEGKPGEEPPRVIFSVSDTGVGIPADDLPRIFERFYKADRARSSGGTGLGLAIARHTVEAHQGKIWAESIEGRGSTFFFSIPTI
jgi:two-component system phosphate regulon sensor histidine kinase PhoR